MRMIAILRSVIAVVIGYLVFAVTAFAMFRVTGQEPHAPASMAFMLGSSGAGMLFAGLGGYLAGIIAERRPLAHGVAVAAVLAVGAGVSLTMTLGHGAIWSQVAALTLMAPSAAAGGWLLARKNVAANNNPTR